MKFRDNMVKMIKESLDSHSNKYHVRIAVSPADVYSIYCGVYDSIFDYPEIKTVLDIFARYGIRVNKVDTVEGSFNLNRDYLETASSFLAVVEYGGVFPLDWEVEDIYTLVALEYSGKILIRVSIYNEDEKFLCFNH